MEDNSNYGLRGGGRSEMMASDGHDPQARPAPPAPPRPKRSAVSDPRPRATGGPATLDSYDLVGDAKRLFINHDGRRYLLRVTKQNKLLLTRDEQQDG
ncbi:MAG: hemin uptake protein HemP [Pseudomonadota bacterium]